MNCHLCKYQKQIDALRRRCLACNPESDAGTPHGRVKADEFTLNSAPKAADFDRELSRQVTKLDSTSEHKLRVAMSSLFALDPIDLLLVQHMMNADPDRRNLEAFSGTLDGIISQLRYYHGSTRAMAWARKEKILDKFPQFRAVITNDREFDAAARMRTELAENGKIAPNARKRG